MSDLRWYPKWRREPVTAPAAGAGFTRKNDSAGLWIVRGIMFRLVTSAAVANRVVSVRASAAEDTWFAVAAQTAQTATLTRDYCTYPGSSVHALDAPTLTLGWPTDGLWLPEGHDLAVTVAAIDATDQVSAIFLDLVEYPDVEGDRLTPFPYAYRTPEG